ncbi:hypothetical protein AVEN_45745-1 [Araneus ventricosus]|uniref:Uncharacterized protein n=1 Tax=Araneus ventricosus TaxID=182803 RepID=A0A4Y2UT36_ARAVE|nr:hypothetical protein AVEN_101595-1 [Araneus ventricosus]GBO16149.1 hypothetical protein AVEN_45745-1 [Araneus ventricosus]
MAQNYKVHSKTGIVGLQNEVSAYLNEVILLCKSATNLTRQECKLETSYSKRVSHYASNFSQAWRVKLIANYRKNRVRKQPRVRTPTPRFLSLSS